MIVRIDIRLKTMPKTNITENNIDMLIKTLPDVSKGEITDIDDVDTLFVNWILKKNVEFILKEQKDEI